MVKKSPKFEQYFLRDLVGDETFLINPKMFSIILYLKVNLSEFVLIDDVEQPDVELPTVR